VRLRFVQHGTSGVVDVDCVPNLDPPSLGGSTSNLGMPACTATITYPGEGYLAMMGWIQLVRSTDSAQHPDEFEMDPFALFPDVDSPYCFYGSCPTLYDGPGRLHRDDMAWLGHTFLAATPLDRDDRFVRPLQGFSWGFTIVAGTISLSGPTPVPPDAWAAHAPYLKSSYPTWEFTADAVWAT